MKITSPSMDPYTHLGRISKPNDKSVFVSCDLDFTELPNGNHKVKSYHMVVSHMRTAISFDVTEDFVKSVLDYIQELKKNGYPKTEN